MLERTAYLEVLGEVVFPVHTEHCLALLGILRVALERHIDRRSGVYDALIENGHLTEIVIHGIVGAFGQHHSTGRHDDRTLRNVHRSERYDIGKRTAELSRKHILVLLGYLFRDGLCRIIQLGEGIFGRLCSRHALTDKIIIHIASERFGLREEHTAVADCISVHIVEVSVRIRLHIVVKTVGTENLYKSLVLNLRFGYITQIDSGCVALELDVETELVLLNRRCKIIYILHHQVPVALLRVVAGVLQRLHEERLIDVGDVRRELTHLIGHASISIFISHSEHLVGLKRGLERNISKRGINRIFRRIEQSRALKFLIVGAAHKSRDAVEHR